jgi:hypothetical protein
MVRARMRPSELAEQFPAHPTTVSAWRRGEPPSDPTRQARLAALLGVSRNWLMTGRGEPNEGLAGNTEALHTQHRAWAVREDPALYSPNEASGEVEGAGWMWGDPSLAQERIEIMLRDVEHSVRTSSTGLTPRGLLQLRAAVLDDLVFQCREAGRPVPSWLALLAYDAARQLR